MGTISNSCCLHALHYHKIDVFEKQKEIEKRNKANLHDLLSFPVTNKPNWTAEEINNEISNCAQSILDML